MYQKPDYGKMEFARGEVWYVSAEPISAGVTSLGRWVVIVTSDYGCKTSPSLLCVPMTTQLNGQHRSVNTLVESGERKRVALGNQVTPIPKNMFRYKDSCLTAKEMEQVEMCVLIAMGIKEREDKSEDKSAELTVERDLYKRLYEKALEQLCELRFVRDEQPEAETVIEVPVEAEVDEYAYPEEPLYLEEAEVSDEPIDLSKPEPKVRKKKRGEPGVKTGKHTVNVNNATWYDLHTKLGLGQTVAKRIIGARKKLGRFTCEEELACVQGMGRNNLRKIEGRIVFDDADVA